jgi:hypothetical protein
VKVLVFKEDVFDTDRQLVGFKESQGSLIFKE